MKFKQYPNSELMMTQLAQLIAAQLAAILAHSERASLAVPGGSTPGPIFDTLSGAGLECGLDWARVDVLLSDERWLPEDHSRSNTRLLRERLLVDKAASARLIPLYANTAQPEESLGVLSDGVRAALPLSVLLLGMGDDMHIASLFPGADKLADGLSAKAPPLLAMRAPAAPEPRITLTAPVLNGAMSKHLVITGSAKRAAFRRAESLTPDIAPVRAVMRDLNVHWAP